jgi:hypothetical protein
LHAPVRTSVLVAVSVAALLLAGRLIAGPLATPSLPTPTVVGRAEPEPTATPSITDTLIPDELSAAPSLRAIYLQPMLHNPLGFLTDTTS